LDDIENELMAILVLRLNRGARHQYARTW